VEVRLEEEEADHLLNEHRPMVLVRLHLSLEDLHQLRVLSANDPIVLLAQLLQYAVVLSSRVGRPLSFKDDSDLTEDRPQLEFEVALLLLQLLLRFRELRLSLAGVVNEYFDDALGEEEDAVARTALGDEHVFRLAEFGGQLLDHVVQVFHIGEVVQVTLARHRLVVLLHLLLEVVGQWRHPTLSQAPIAHSDGLSSALLLHAPAFEVHFTFAVITVFTVTAFEVSLFFTAALFELFHALDIAMVVAPLALGALGLLLLLGVGVLKEDALKDAHRDLLLETVRDQLRELSELFLLVLRVLRLLNEANDLFLDLIRQVQVVHRCINGIDFLLKDNCFLVDVIDQYC